MTAEGSGSAQDTRVPNQRLTTMSAAVLFLLSSVALLVFFAVSGGSEVPGGGDGLEANPMDTERARSAAFFGLPDTVAESMLAYSDSRADQLQPRLGEARALTRSVPAEVLNLEVGADLKDAVAAAERVASASNPSSFDLRRASARLGWEILRVREQEEVYAELLAEFGALFAHSRASVAAVDLESGLPIVAYRASEPFIAASTYKVFVAYSMMNAVDSEELTWDSPFLGTTLGECFDRMLTYSDNECPVHWFGTYGRELVNDQAKMLGARNTDLTGLPNLMTDATDLAVALRALAADGVVHEDSRDLMIDLMMEQGTRDGIPAGIESDRVRVADKVGYLDNLLHDVAIVYTDKGDFTLVVLTENSTWESIANVARLVYEYL